MDSSPLVILAYAAVATYLGKIYLEDFGAWRDGQRRRHSMPGATSAPRRAYLLGVTVALAILALETMGELALGVADEQSDVAVLFLLAMVAAGVIEEVVFRGYLVVTGKGRAALVGSIVGFSLLFALLHPFLWEYSTAEGVATWQFWSADLSFTLTAKSVFSTGVVFVNSLWFYALRFGPWNPHRSIFPCVAAHVASNVGVFAVKLVQGHVTGLVAA